MGKPFVAFTKQQFDDLDQLITSMLGRLDAIEQGGLEQYVADWLEAHPEATTTVEDGSITFAKLASDSDYMTTEEVLAFYD